MAAALLLVPILSAQATEPAEESNEAQILPSGITLKDLSGSWSGSFVAPAPNGEVVTLQASFDDQGLPFQVSDSLGHQWTRAEAMGDVTVTATGLVQLRLRRVIGGTEYLELSGTVSAAGNRFFGGFSLISNASPSGKRERIDPSPLGADPKRKHGLIQPDEVGGTINEPPTEERFHPDRDEANEPPKEERAESDREEENQQGPPRDERFEGPTATLVAGTVGAMSGSFELLKWQGASAPEGLGSSLSGGVTGGSGKLDSAATLRGLVKDGSHRTSASRR